MNNKVNELNTNRR